MTQRNIVVFRTGQLGDTVVALPALRAIRQKHPHHRLIFLTPIEEITTRVSPVDVLGAANLFDETLSYYLPSLRPGVLAAWFELIRKLRAIRPEVFYYLRDYPHPSFRRDNFFFRYVIGWKDCYGLEPEKYSFGDRDENGRLIRYPREVERLLDVASQRPRSVKQTQKIEFGVPIGQKEISRVSELWREIGINADQLVVAVAPGSKMAAKKWPMERFIATGRALLSKYVDVRLLIFGGDEDVPLGIEMIESLGDKVITLAGQLSVLESAEGLRRCHAYVGNDTGVMHLAAAVGTPCIAIFSARDHPGRWEPIGDKHVVLRKDPPCAGCLLDVCTTNAMKCLTDITVDAVFSAVVQVLSSQRVERNARPSADILNAEA